MFKEGDIVEIPLPDQRVAIGRIIHISSRFNNGLGFIVFGIKGEPSAHITTERCTFLGPMYTSIKAAEHYGWRTIQSIPMKDRDRALTRRRVGGGIYVADEYLGSAEELQEENLGPMLLYGMIAVYNEINKAFGEKKGAGQ